METENYVSPATNTFSLTRETTPAPSVLLIEPIIEHHGFFSAPFRCIQMGKVTTYNGLPVFQARGKTFIKEAMRRGFYLILGFTFPGFWTFHAGGFASWLYRPLQVLCRTEATGWPSFITASLIYISLIVLFEVFALAWSNTHP